MKTNSISRTNFEGRVLFDKKLSKPMRDYADKVIDSVYNNIFFYGWW